MTTFIIDETVPHSHLIGLHHDLLDVLIAVDAVPAVWETFREATEGLPRTWRPIMRRAAYSALKDAKKARLAAWRTFEARPGLSLLSQWMITVAADEFPDEVAEAIMIVETGGTLAVLDDWALDHQWCDDYFGNPDTDVPGYRELMLAAGFFTG